MRALCSVLLAIGCLLPAATARTQEATPRDPPQEQGSPRVHTSRPGKHLIGVPTEDDAFQFVVYGDRTGGVPAGLKVLRQAVTDTNLMDPDLVMTVGDMIQGYNQTTQWLAQMREFRQIMNRLSMPWFPVAGNHDVYWRGPADNKPLGEHERNYEQHFGPLYYAFTHKGCWFIVLYSDEGDPVSNRKAFNRPELQKMSPEQFAWLGETLEKSKDARHVFVFLHHPRWLRGGYGDDWERVHQLLAAQGNVSAVFAGHIHRMKYSGPRDGIEYFALATTGGHLSREIPGAGFLHHYNVVTVRDQSRDASGVQVATVPVGAVLDPRQISPEMSDEIAKLDSARVEFSGMAELAADGSMTRQAQDAAGAPINAKLTFTNPTSRPVEFTYTAVGLDHLTTVTPDHQHFTVQPNASAAMLFSVLRQPGGLENFRMPELAVQAEYLGTDIRITLPEKRVVLEPKLPATLPGGDGTDRALHLDGDGDAAVIPSKAIELPDGSVTVEARMRAAHLDGRTGLVTKTENSELGIFVTDGQLEFCIHLNGGYRIAKTDEAVLPTGTWCHVAGVYDAEAGEVRAYLDGKLVARGDAPKNAKRTRNRFPWMVGADVDGRGGPTSFFSGQLDDVRIRSIAAYSGDTVKPIAAGAAPTEGDLLFLPMDWSFAGRIPDGTGRGGHARLQGDARVASPTR